MEGIKKGRRKGKKEVGSSNSGEWGDIIHTAEKPPSMPQQRYNMEEKILLVISRFIWCAYIAIPAASHLAAHRLIHPRRNNLAVRTQYI